MRSLTSSSSREGDDGEAWIIYFRTAINARILLIVQLFLRHLSALTIPEPNSSLFDATMTGSFYLLD